MKKPDPFLEMIKNKEADKKRVYTDALLFGKSEARTDSGRAFVKSLQEQFDAKGYLSQKQIAALYKVDSEPTHYYNDEYYDEYGEYPDDDFDPFDH